MPSQEETGLYLPATETLYLIAQTRWTNHQLSIDRIRKILLAKGLMNFTGAALSGSQKDIAMYYPQVMTLKEAQLKDYKIEYLYGSETEKVRSDKTNIQTAPAGKASGLFKKKEQK